MCECVGTAASLARDSGRKPPGYNVRWSENTKNRRHHTRRCAHTPSITRHHRTHRLTICKTSCSTRPAPLITAGKNPPNPNHNAAGARRPRGPPRRASRHLPASPSDTPHPINGVSPLIFVTLICAAPEAALIRTECDNFNDQTKQATNKPKDLLLNHGGAGRQGDSF